MYPVLIIGDDLVRITREEVAKLRRPVTDALNRRGRALRDDLRQEARSKLGNSTRIMAKVLKAETGFKGLGQNVEKVIQQKLYPERKPSLRAATYIYSPWPVLEVHEQGAIIKARNGRWLAIPTDEAVKRGFGTNRVVRSTSGPNRGQFQRGNLARASQVEKAIATFGKALRFLHVYGRSVAVLALDPAVAKAKGIRGRKTYTDAKGKRRRGLIVLFVLVRQVGLRARLQFAPIVARHRQALLPDLTQAVEKTLKEPIAARAAPRPDLLNPTQRRLVQ